MEEKINQVIVLLEIFRILRTKENRNGRRKVYEILNTSLKDDIELNFNEMHMWPEFDFDEFNNIPVYEENAVS